MPELHGANEKLAESEFASGSITVTFPVYVAAFGQVTTDVAMLSEPVQPGTLPLNVRLPAAVSGSLTVTRIVNAEVVPGVHAGGAGVSHSTRVMTGAADPPASTGGVPESTGGVPESTGGVPESTGGEPESTGGEPESCPASAVALPASRPASASSAGESHAIAIALSASTAQSVLRSVIAASIPSSATLPQTRRQLQVGYRVHSPIGSCHRGTTTRSSVSLRPARSVRAASTSTSRS